MDLLNKHVTIRNFQKRPVETNLLESIIYSGTRASTTGNMQVYSVIVTRDEQQKQKLAPLHFNQPVAVNAPVLLTFVADFHRFSVIAKASCAEVRSQLYLASDIGYLNEDDFNRLMKLASETTRIIGGLGRSIDRQR